MAQPLLGLRVGQEDPYWKKRGMQLAKAASIYYEPLEETMLSSRGR